MKVEVGKFYKTRDGRKVGPMESSPYPYDVCFYSQDKSVTKQSWHPNGDFIRGAKTVLDLIEEWKEAEVKEPKFKVGDRVRDLTWEGGKHIGTVVSYENGEYQADYSPHHYGVCVGLENDKWSRLELVESAKPEITVGSRWTSIGKVSNIITVVHVNDKYVAFEHDGRETIGSTTVDRFHQFYAPYVQPPKSLVGYVGVIDDGDRQRFTLVCKSEEEVRRLYSVTNYNIVAVKKIEWTEGE